MELLSVKNMTKRFFGVTALDDVNLSVDEKEIVGLIGPNGSGKTTLFNCIGGFLPAEKESKVFYRFEDISGKRPDEIARRRISRTFQIVNIFPQLTTLENLMVAIQQHQEDSILERFLHTEKIRRFEHQAEERADDLLAYVGLSRHRDEPAVNLSYGERKLLEFATALMPDPELVLLDEPTSAVNPVMIDKMKHLVVRLNENEGKTFFIIEHNMDVVMDICHRIIVLDHGVKIAEGLPERIRTDERVVEAYFGR